MDDTELGARHIVRQRQYDWRDLSGPSGYTSALLLRDRELTRFEVLHAGNDLQVAFFHRCSKHG